MSILTINYFRTDYKNFGKCVCIDNGTIRLMATVDVGPRIIYFGFSDGKNVLFEDTDRNFSLRNGSRGTWYAYGGHRIWSAPENLDETYYPDNQNVRCTFENGILDLEQSKTEFDKKFGLRCSFVNDYTVHVENRITNCSDTTQVFAPWSITGLAPGGTEYINLCSKDNGFLPNRTIALWSYSDIYDSRFRLNNDKAVLIHDPDAETAFKVGFNLTDTSVTYINNEIVFTKTFDGYNNKFTYPDFGCNFETYTNKHFLECELLGDLRGYAPSQTAVIHEEWTLSQVK